MAQAVRERNRFSDRGEPVYAFLDN